MLEMLGAVTSTAVIDTVIHASGCSWQSIAKCPGKKGAPSMQSAGLQLASASSSQGTMLCVESQNTNFIARQPTWYRKAHAGGWHRSCIAVQTNSTPPCCSFLYLHWFSPPCLANSECCMLLSPEAHYHFKYAMGNLI